MHARSRCKKLEIAVFAKKTRCKRMPEVVVVRVPMESQSEPEVVEESGRIDGAVERVIAFVTDEH